MSKINNISAYFMLSSLNLKIPCNSRLPKSEDTFRFEAEIFLKLLDVTVRQDGHTF
jgi:hypothetical protein